MLPLLASRLSAKRHVSFVFGTQAVAVKNNGGDTLQFDFFTVWQQSGTTVVDEALTQQKIAVAMNEIDASARVTEYT